MQEVAPLAQRGEVARCVVLRVVIEVARRQEHPRPPHRQDGAVRRWQASVPLALPATPSAGVLVPPQAVAEVQHFAPVRPTAALATALGAAEPDRRRQLVPVDRVKPAVVPADRHGE